MKKKETKQPKVNHCWNTIGVWSEVTDKCEKLSEHIHCRNCPVFSEEGKRVLDRKAPAGYLTDWRKSLSSDKKTYKNNNNSALVFQIGEEWFGMPSHCLHEITEERTVHRIPRNNNKNISGVVNVGGEVRVCYSLENILGVKVSSEYSPESNDSVVGRFVVVFLGGQYYVFSVNQISGLFWYGDDEFSPVPATLDFEGRGLLLGVVDHNKNKVAVLDVGKFQQSMEGIRL